MSAQESPSKKRCIDCDWDEENLGDRCPPHKAMKSIECDLFMLEKFTQDMKAIKAMNVTTSDKFAMMKIYLRSNNDFEECVIGIMEAVEQETEK